MLAYGWEKVFMLKKLFSSIVSSQHQNGEVWLGLAAKQLKEIFQSNFATIYRPLPNIKLRK